MDSYGVECGVVISICHVGGVVPVDVPACPCDGARGIALSTCGPDGEFDTARGLWVVVLVCGAVEGGGFLECADGGAVDRPGYRVWLPVELVDVEVLHRVAGDRGVAAIVVVFHALPVVVCLGLGEVVADEFEVDFVLDIGEQDEGRDNTVTAAG